MDLRLRVVAGKHAGKEIPVSGGRLLIGRGEDCHLRPGSDQISRHHCVILVDTNGAAIRDFGSRNGTYLNGSRIDGEHELRPGDRLQIGPLLFDVRDAAQQKPIDAPVSDRAAAPQANRAEHLEPDDSLGAASESPRPETSAPSDTQVGATVFDSTKIGIAGCDALPIQPPPDAEPPSKVRAAAQQLKRSNGIQAKDSRQAAEEVLRRLRTRQRQRPRG